MALPTSMQASASSASGPAYAGLGSQTGAPISTGQVVINTGEGSIAQTPGAGIPWLPILGGLAALGLVIYLVRK